MEKGRSNIFVSIVILLVAINVAILVLSESSNSDETNNNTRISNKGSIAFGAYDENGKIETGTLIIDKVIEHEIELVHNLPGTSNYLLMVLVDYEQVPFNNNGAETYFRKIKLEPDNTARIDVSYTIQDNATDLCYLIIKEPDYLFEQEDIDRGHILQQVISMQYKLNVNANANEVKLSKLRDYSMGGPIPDIFLSQKSDELVLTYFMPEESKVVLTIGNNFETKCRFGVIKLLNWEQIDFKDSHVKYFDLEAGQKGYFEDILPSVDVNSNIQYISFPFAKEVDLEKIVKKLAEGTFRLKVEPSE